MNITLVKIDVATVDLGKSVRHLEQLVDGGTAHEKGLLWIFNLAKDPGGRCRNLRFWRPELIARSRGEPEKYHRCKIDDIIALILPASRMKFRAGEVDQLLQLRPRIRIDFGAELAGSLDQGSHVYSRPTLAGFLKRRWLGASLGKAFSA
ncbi:MAG TPA: hypothetical protein DCQ92_12455 [Verrucomicrobia subdivision 3 bacterium]|nr:hypothetical protein [Limisphaerales bacterium]